jgi:bile acid:Na+ symporter, BASS family
MMDIFLAAFFPLALVTIMFSLGLSLQVADFVRVVKFPKAFAIGALCQLIMLPTTAYLVAIAFGLPPQLALGLMILSFCPGGPTSNMMTKLAHGDVALSISLTGMTSLVTVFTMPLLLKLFADHFLGLSAPQIDVTGLGFSLFGMMTVPVAVGIVLRRYATDIVIAVERFVFALALGFFALVVIGALAINWTPFLENLMRLGPSVIALNILMLGVGLGVARLFALDRAQATAIAIESGIQNAALGITVGSLIVERAADLPPFSLPSGVYGITMYFVSIPFTLYRRRLALA